MKPKLILGLALVLGSVLVVGLLAVVKRSIANHGLVGVLFWLGIFFVIVPVLGTLNWFYVGRKKENSEQERSALLLLYMVAAVMLVVIGIIFFLITCLGSAVPRQT